MILLYFFLSFFALFIWSMLVYRRTLKFSIQSMASALAVWIFLIPTVNFPNEHSSAICLMVCPLAAATKKRDSAVSYLCMT